MNTKYAPQIIHDLVERFVNRVGRILNAPQVGRLAGQQLCDESHTSLGLWPINGRLSTLGAFYDLAHTEWVFQEKDAFSQKAAKRIPDSRDMHSTGIKFDFTTLKNPDASIRVTVAG